MIKKNFPETLWNYKEKKERSLYLQERNKSTNNGQNQPIFEKYHKNEEENVARFSNIKERTSQRGRNKN